MAALPLPRLSPRLRAALSRILFALLTTAIVVVMSEKMYWYVTGYAYFDVLIGYFLPVYAFLTLVDAARVRGLAPLFLAAAVFGFLVEGVIVPVLYEDGPLGWFNVSYTPLAWHVPLSVVFGWYLVRQWLITGNRRALALGSAAAGLFWGIWSLAWWLPENVSDAELLASGARLGPWPVWEFAAHAFIFTGFMALAHVALGSGGWRPEFRPSRLELALVGAGLLLAFTTQVLPVAWWTPLKLGAALAAAIIPLALWQRSQPEGSLLATLDGRFPPARVLPLLIMPATAVAVYALATALQPPTDLIYVLTAMGQVLGSAVLGWIAFLAAIILTLWSRRVSVPCSPATSDQSPPP